MYDSIHMLLYVIYLYIVSVRIVKIDNVIYPVSVMFISSLTAAFSPWQWWLCCLWNR